MRYIIYLTDPWLYDSSVHADDWNDDEIIKGKPEDGSEGEE